MVKLGGGCVVLSPDDGDRQEVGTESARLTIGAAIDARDIAQCVRTFAPGLSRGRMNPASEEVHYVVRGHGACYVDGHRYGLEPGSAVYVPPGTDACFEAAGPDALEVVSVCCPEPAAAEIDLPPRTAPEDPVSTPPFRVVHEHDRKTIPTGERTFKLLADKDVGCQRVTQFLGVIPPSVAPPHYHTYEEAIYILDGEGRLWAEDVETPVGQGSCIYLPRGVRHSLQNHGSHPIRLLGVFHPSGSPAARYGDEGAH